MTTLSASTSQSRSRFEPRSADDLLGPVGFGHAAHRGDGAERHGDVRVVLVGRVVQVDDFGFGRGEDGEEVVDHGGVLAVLHFL